MSKETEILEYIPDAVYFLSGSAAPPARPSDDWNHGDDTGSTYRMEYIFVDAEFPYANFYLDFGPLHLGHVFTFSCRLNERMREIGAASDSDNNQADTSELSQRICIYSSLQLQRRANAACLLGCWAVLFNKWTASRAFEPFQRLRLPTFHDATPNQDTFRLSVLHVLQGLERAVNCGLLRGGLDGFDIEAYHREMDPTELDLTWVTPAIAAFASPQRKRRSTTNASVEEYTSYFHANNVSLVLRLSSPSYDTEPFSVVGIRVVDLYFPDGACPPVDLVHRFLDLVEAHAKSRIAVHCKAGLGRTGTLIACMLMARHGFTAEEAIAWLRLCRPGSVIGQQQQFLRDLCPVFCGRPTKINTAAAAKEDADPEADNASEPQTQGNQRQIKGIAKRDRSLLLNESVKPLGHRSNGVLPPKIPGRKPPHPATLSRPSTPTQGDLLLQRKQLHASTLQLPLGVSLWSLSSA